MSEHQPLVVARVKGEPSAYFVGKYSEFDHPLWGKAAEFKDCVKFMTISRQRTPGGPIEVEMSPMVDPVFPHLIFPAKYVYQLKEPTDPQDHDIRNAYDHVLRSVKAKRSGIELAR